MRIYEGCSTRPIDIEEVLKQLNHTKNKQYIKEAHNIDEQKKVIKNIEYTIETMSLLYPTEYTEKKLEIIRQKLEIEKTKMETFYLRDNN